jgi:hypothetical protein
MVEESASALEVFSVYVKAETTSFRLMMFYRLNPGGKWLSQGHWTLLEVLTSDGAMFVLNKENSNISWNQRI